MIPEPLQTIKCKVINEAKTYGKMPKRVPIQNEELILPDYKIEPKKESKVSVEQQMQAKRAKKTTSTTKSKAAKHIPSTPKPKSQISG